MASCHQSELTLEKYSLTYYMPWHRRNWYPNFSDCPLFIMRNATLKFRISLSMASSQRVFPFSLSMEWASLVLRRIWIINLLVFLCCILLTALIIVSLFRRVKLIHHLKAGSLSICWVFAYLATSDGFDSLMSASCSQVVVQSFRRMQKNHPLVVFFYFGRSFTTTSALAFSVAVCSFF